MVSTASTGIPDQVHPDSGQKLLSSYNSQIQYLSNQPTQAFSGLMNISLSLL